MTVNTRLIIFIALLSINGSKLKAQAKAVNRDAFKKYSYNILGYRKLDSTRYRTVGATGFFIRKNKKLFFVTALHTLNGCIDNDTKIDNFPDSLYIVIKKDSKNKDKFLSIPTLKDQPCSKADLVPDFELLEMPNNNVELNKVYSVENFLMPPFKSVNQMQIFGFPGKSYITDKEYVLLETSEINLKINDTKIRQATIVDRIDSVNFWVDTDKYVDSVNGYSGSPVFMKDTNSDRWRIAGIFIGATTASDEEKPYFIICRTDYLIKELNTSHN